MIEEGMKMRVKYIDYTKGLAILLMLFGHTITQVNKIHKWIYSFHMPIFFIICGSLMYINIKRNSDIKNKIWRRIYAAGIPYYVFGIILVFFYTILDIMSGRQGIFWNRLFKLVTLQGVDSLWFLPIYVSSDIIFFILMNKKMKYIKFMTGINFLLAIFLEKYMITMWYFQILYKILLALCFIAIGFFISKYEIIKRLNIFSIVILLIIGWILAQINGSVEMAIGHIGNPIIYFFTAIVTSVSIMGILKKMESKENILILKILELYGKNSIVILCTNNLLIEIIRLLDFKIMGNALISMGMSGSILLFIVLMLIEYPIIQLANGILAPIFGNIK